MQAQRIDTRPRPRASLRALFFVIRMCLAFIALEGLASVLYVVLDIVPAAAPPPERGHTRYDADLGWSSQPNALIRHAYGRGIPIRINSQGLRADGDFAFEKPPGKVRVICSGDSFTFGHGVKNTDTWCEQLAALDPRLEPLNMGQGAYGLDQAYLWFMRDGVKFENDVHVLAFITENITRMRRAEFNGYGKPVLRIVDGQLHVENVPVPERKSEAPATQGFLNGIRQLRSMQLLSAFYARIRQRGAFSGAALLDDAETRNVIAKLVESLRDIDRAKGSTLIVVHLPTRYELGANGEWAGWKPIFETESKRLDVPFFDLQADVEGMPEEVGYTMFLTPHGGHYSVTGNRLVARLLTEKLATLPEIARKLEAIGTIP